ncbi:MAG: TolC family protein [Muribaculaceae bacterium]|nr:TolC family protein [Muribaculaceae bacterium]
MPLHNRFPALAGLLILTATATFAQADSVLSLEQCIAVALSDNPTIKVADMEIQRVDYSRKETLGQLLPSVSFGAQYNRMLAKQVAYMNMDAFGDFGQTPGDDSEPLSRSSSDKKSDGGIKMGLDNSYSLGFNASLPLVAPQLWQSISLSDSQILYSLEQSRSSRLQLVNQVKAAYYALMLAEDSRRVIRESYDMAALTPRTYTMQYEAGAASDYDVLRTSVAMKNIEPELLQADVAIKRARLQLQLLMGIDSSFPITTSQRLSDYEDDMYARTLALDRDFSRNSDLELNRIETGILDRTVKLRKAAYYPTLALTANYNWTSSSDGSPFRNFRWNPYSTIGLTLSVPLFEGGQRYNQVRQAQVQANEMRLQRENLERSIAMQVDLAIDNIGVNVRQIASCSESVGEAERAHSIMEESFGIGAASYLDLRDSELALTRARLTYFQAIYNYLIAMSELELLQGTYPIEQHNEQ